MSERYIVRFQEEELTVGVTEEGEGFQVEIDGETIHVDSRSIVGNATRSLLIDGVSFEVATMPARDGTDVYVSGDVYHLRVTDELWARAAEGAKAVADGEQIVSPMPGGVVAIKVELGQTVEPGDVVAVVEAMKMQNDLAASYGGKVVEIRAKPGDVVEQDAVLVVLKSDEAS